MQPNPSSVDLLTPPTTLTENENLLELLVGNDIENTTGADLLEPPIDTPLTPEEKAERLTLRLARCNKSWIMRPTLETRGWKFAYYKCGHRLICMSCGNEYAVHIASNILTKIRSRRSRGESKLVLFEIPNKADASELVNGLSKNHYHHSPTPDYEYIIIDPSELPPSKLAEFKNQHSHQYLTPASIEKLDWGAITQTIQGRRPSGKLATVAVNNSGKVKISSRIIQTNAPINILELVTKVVDEKTKNLQPTNAKELEAAIIQLSELAIVEIQNYNVRYKKNWYISLGTINAYVDLDRLDWTIKNRS